MAHRLLGALLAATMIAAAPASRADEVDAYITHALAAARVPAVAVAAVKQGKVVKLRAYGQANLELGVAATPDTAFSLASGTKFFTGILVMRMVQQGRLKLDDRVADHLPDVPEAWRRITIAQLAGHASGLPDATVPLDTFGDVIAWAKTQPLAYRPGERAVYSQTEFAVLGAILEKVSGRTYEALLADEIVTPLGLTSTRYAHGRQEASILGSTLRTADLVPRRATLYKWDGSRQQTFEYLFPAWNYPAAALHSSAADLAKIFAALDGDELLTKESKRIIATAYRLEGGQPGPFGVAWVIRQWRGRALVGHSGGPAHSDIWWQPGQGVSVAVLTNQVNFAPVLADALLERLEPTAPPSHPAVPDDDPATSARLLGWARASSTGQVPRTMLSADADPGVINALPLLAPALATFAPAGSWTLIAAGKDEKGLRTRSYAARHGPSQIAWSFTLDASGGIVRFWPQPE